MANRAEYNEYMAAIGKKINAAMPDLAKGRTDEALVQTVSRIQKSCGNLYFKNGGKYVDPVKAVFKGFSEDVSFSDISNVDGTDVVDISIQASQASVMNYLVAERGMDKPSEIFTFSGLKEMNNTAKAGIAMGPTGKTAGAVAAGAEVYNPFKKLDGINLKGHEIGVHDSTDRAKIVRVRPTAFEVTVHATPTNIILENDFLDSSWMNKQIFDLGNSGIDVDWSSRAIRQLMELYVKSIDLTCVVETAKAMLMEYTRTATGVTMGNAKAPAEILKMSDYSLTTSDVDTKNDLIQQLMRKLNSKLLKSSGYNVTCWLVDNAGADLLAGDPNKFVEADSYATTADGFIGTYNKIPVVRHSVLDGILDYTSGTDTVITAFIGGLHKDADGRIAPACYSEYVAMFSANPALNFANPTETAESLQGINTADVVAPELAVLGRVDF